MDMLIAALCAIAIIIGVPVLAILVTISVGILVGVGIGIYGRTVDFFEDASAGHESTDFGGKTN